METRGQPANKIKLTPDSEGDHDDLAHLGLEAVPGHAAAPNHAAVAEVQRLGPGEHAAQTQTALVALIGVPAVVRNN